jgi:hypothetical protein
VMADMVRQVMRKRELLGAFANAPGRHLPC